jgi:hypothetical protein
LLLVNQLLSPQRVLLPLALLDLLESGPSEQLLLLLLLLWCHCPGRRMPALRPGRLPGQQLLQLLLLLQTPRVRAVEATPHLLRLCLRLCLRRLLLLKLLLPVDRLLLLLLLLLLLCACGGVWVCMIGPCACVSCYAR